MYDISNSHLTVRTEAAREVMEEVGVCEDETKTMLFTTKTCPNCRIVGMRLDEAEIPYEKVDAEEAADLVEKYGVRQAPTLVVVKDGKVETFANASNIIGYIDEN